MFFIFGAPRSGTTLLSATLDLHSQIVVPQETDCIVPLVLIVERVPDPAVGRALISRLVVSTARFADSLGEHLSAADVERAVAAAPYTAAGILDALYGAIAARLGKRLAGDKSPNDLGSVFILRRAGVFASDFKVIHIVRDVRDVVLSLRAVGWVQRPELSFARAWSQRNVAVHEQFKDEPERYRLLRFEDLVADPPAVVRALTEFLGVPFEPAMLEPDQRGLRARREPHHQNLAQPFLRERAHAWRGQMDPEMLRLCDENAREGLRLFGYSTA
jgi:hypothetical protein